MGVNLYHLVAKFPMHKSKLWVWQAYVCMGGPTVGAQCLVPLSMGQEHNPHVKCKCKQAGNKQRQCCVLFLGCVWSSVAEMEK